MKKYAIITCASVLLFFLFVWGEGLIAQATREESIRIKDATGRYVEIRLPVKRIVVLPSDALEMVRALGAKDLVVGISDGIPKEPLFWPELKDRPVVGRWSEVNHELIAELKPDLVICYGRWPGPELEKKLTPFGIKVIRLDFYRICTLEKEVKIFGRILNREKEAKELTTWYREKLNLIQEELKHVNHRPDVYVESYTQYHTTGPGSGGHEMCIMAGGRNIASNFSIPYPEITPEWVLAKNPHVIIKAVSFSNCYAMIDSSLLKGVRNKIMARPAWDNIRSVRDGKVYVLSSDIWAGPRVIVGISYMAKWFYPDMLRDFDPEELHGEYLERFQGIKYQGIYVYPQ